jgi:hypothetical protein
VFSLADLLLPLVFKTDLGKSNYQADRLTLNRPA